MAPEVRGQSNNPFPTLLTEIHNILLYHNLYGQI